MYDLAIIGGGPAGVAAGVYAARKKLKTVFITKDFGGQSIVSTEIQNWIGTVAISGLDLADNLKKHLKTYSADVVDIKEGVWANEIVKNKDIFEIKTSKGDFKTKTVLVAAGSRRRKLEAKGADEFEHKGITYCASCDGPFFADKDVIVVGAGNAGFETTAQLLAYAKSVTMLVRSETFKADPVTVEKVSADPKMRILLNSEIIEVKGENFVKSTVIKNNKTGELKDFLAEGIFMEIGSVPNTDMVKNLVKIDSWNQVVVDPKTQRASISGVWAAGDCTNGLYHQNNIAAGDAVKAVEDIYFHLRAK
jgi:alkyl hydroperoxide reductase subunit F